MPTLNVGPSRIATCGSCPAHWTGLERCHCSACHETFASVTAFTRHRRATRTRGQCLSPSAAGLSRIGGFWQLPPMSHAARLALWTARRAQDENGSASTAPMVGDNERTGS